MSSATSLPNLTRLDCLLMSICCSLISVTTMVCNSIVSWDFLICFQIIWICFRVSTSENLISAAHCLAVSFFRPFAEFPAIAPVIFIYVFSPRTKNISSCNTDIDAAAATADPAFLWGASNLRAYGHLTIVPSSHSFCQAFSFWDRRVTTIMSISVALVSLFITFT